PAERTGKLVLRVLKLLDLVGIGKLRNIQLHLCCFGARLHDRGQNFSFLFGEALNGSDQIWDKISTALLIVLHIRPFRLGLLLVSGDGVVTTTGNCEPKERGSNNATNARYRYGHVGPSSEQIEIRQFFIRDRFVQALSAFCNTSDSVAIPCDANCLLEPISAPG